MQKRVLFIDTTHPALPDLLVEAGFFCDHFYSKNLAELETIIADYDGIIVRSKFKLEKNILEKAINLKFIGRVGAGLENIDIEFANQHNIQCFNAPEGNRDAVGEHAIGMLLALNNHFLRIDAQVRKGIWIREENRGVELSGKTIAIIGYGNMGSSFAKKLSGFDCKVISYDKYKFNYSDDFTSEVTMDEVFNLADVVSLHLPLTPETEYLCDDSWFKKFKKNIVLINTARGKIVKTVDLVQHIELGKICGACLDVLEYEKVSFESLDSEMLPAPFKYLINSEKVLLSPHVAGWTLESNFKLAKTIAEKIINQCSKPTGESQ